MELSILQVVELGVVSNSLRLLRKKQLLSVDSNLIEINSNLLQV